LLSVAVVVADDGDDDEEMRFDEHHGRCETPARIHTASMCEVGVV
jgi:hypothetical protein